MDARKAGAVSAVVSVALAVVDRVSRAEYMAGFIAEPFRKHLPTVYLVGFAVALVLLSWQRPRPRVVVGYDAGRAPDDRGLGTRVLYLRNDGTDTALNLSVRDATVGGKHVTFTVERNFIAAGEEVSVLASGYLNGAGHIEMALVPEIDAAIRRGEERPAASFALHVSFTDHHGQKYAETFIVTFTAHRRANGDGYQAEHPRVTKATRAERRQYAASPAS